MLGTVARLAGLIVFLGWMPALALGYFLSPVAAPFAFIAVGLALTILASRASTLILNEMRAIPIGSPKIEPEIRAGFARSLERITQEFPSIRLPNIHFFSDPTPNALLTKSWDGQVHLCLSRGALFHLNELQLRQLIQFSSSPVAQTDLALRAIGAAFACLLFRMTPAAWVATLYGYPGDSENQALSDREGASFRKVLPSIYTALVHAFLSAVIQLTYRSRPPWLTIAEGEAKGFLAVFDRANRNFASRVNPALGMLMFLNPFPGKSVLNLESLAIRR